VSDRSVPSDTAVAQKPSPSILNPFLDVTCAGGLSILVFVPFLLFVEPPTSSLGERFIVLSTLINFPHFVASYWLLYRSKEMVLRYRVAAIWMPLALAVACAGAVLVGQSNPGYLELITLSSAGYLAWHYTGQAWGMMASYSYVEGVPFTREERVWVRGSLQVLLVFHVAWVLWYSVRSDLTDPYRMLYYVGAASIPAAFLIGGIGLLRYKKRLGRTPPLRVLVPWGAICLWYGVMARGKDAIVLVQLAHALQYLPFPMRVELNSAARRTSPAPLFRWAIGLLLGGSLLFYGPLFVTGVGFRPMQETPPAVAIGGAMALFVLFLVARRFREPGVLPQLCVYGMGILIAGCAAFWFLPNAANGMIMALEDAGPMHHDAAIAVGAFLNIHHYFTDGCVWKVSTPEVRKELFSHLRK
jgi:hypothetical protein